MVKLEVIKKISDYEWEIPKSYRQDMRVPVRFFATRSLLESASSDNSLEQAVNVTTLPGLVGRVVVMPDMHQGYGFPIGCVAATRCTDGVVSPGGIGYDINCGVRLMASSIESDAVTAQLDLLATVIDQNCPSGVGVKGGLRLSDKELDQVCRQGAAWALERGMGEKSDVQRTEEKGCIREADPGKVSARAKERGRTQLGTLGAGNHFIEVDVVDRIYDARSAAAMGLQEGFLAVQVHCGSRGFGHQICTDYVNSFQRAVRQYDIHLPDRELVCAPVESPEGRDYLAAMASAANYAFANRQILVHLIRKAFETVLAGKVKNWHLQQVYDISHNMGKIETHNVDGTDYKVCVHRKGATRAFGPGFWDLPPEYREIGQPVLVPGSMGTASWVLVGRAENQGKTYASSCHGSGRVMSRSHAKKEIRGDVLRNELEKAGIHIRAGSMPGLAEEAPEAYKDVDEVVETVSEAGIARKVARLKPLIVIKG